VTTTQVAFERGATVHVKNTPYSGTVEDVFERPDWGELAYVVMFDHDDPSLPPGGEFSAGMLIDEDNYDDPAGFAEFAN
jgi:hypothetical protein